MMTEMSTSTDPKIAEMAHLFRRAGFGAAPDQLDQALSAGYEATVERLVQAAASGPAESEPALPPLERPDYAAENARLRGLSEQERRQAVQERQKKEREEYQALHTWWLQRMSVTAVPLRERMTLIWHDHFATGFQKVKSAAFMYDQNELLRKKGMGSFPEMVQAAAKDPAMLIWLDSNSNRKGAPNENFARELMELFTLGIGNYTEDDVRQAARAFTGWTLNLQRGAFAFNAGQHDGDYKTVLGKSGNLSGEEVIDWVTTRPASSTFVAAKLFRQLAHTEPSTETLAGLARVYESGNRVIAPLVREILLSSEFRGDASRRSLVRQPADWVAVSARVLGLAANLDQVGIKGVKGKAAGVKVAGNQPLLAAMAGMGQTLFNPPNVGGWGQNSYWLTTAAAQVRLQTSQALALAADHPESLLEVKGAMPGSDASSPSAALLARLGAPDARAETVAALEAYRKSAGSSSEAVRGLVALALITPDVQVG